MVGGPPAGACARRTLDLHAQLDLRLTLGPHRRGRGDPTMRIDGRDAWRATRTPEGPAAVHVRVGCGRVEARASGPGRRHVLDSLPALLGLDDDPRALAPRHALVRDLGARLRGLRIGRTGAVLEALVPAVLEQRVTGAEAWASFRALVRGLGEPAPGPWGLWLQPAAGALAASPYHALHRFGIERNRAETIVRVARDAERVERAVSLPPDEAAASWTRHRGVGPWTAAEVAARALGDPDAVSTGDFHLPHLVTWALAREPRGDDARMLELLEPYRGQRGRVVRLLEAGARRPPRRGPRMAPRRIAAL
ncbi:MAG TPA: DNA-3-methyladenine glycosylase 2 family protein [Actinomycetota bacterium]|nr:DNA-3-methyladenine glycosylase 2 family protein [Actinomycetota bacterium]